MREGQVWLGKEEKGDGQARSLRGGGGGGEGKEQRKDIRNARRVREEGEGEDKERGNEEGNERRGRMIRELNEERGKYESKEVIEKEREGNRKGKVRIVKV